MRRSASLVVLILLFAGPQAPDAQRRQPLSATDIDDIATLLKLEDMRQFDEAALERILRSTHPEVRRRAAVTIGRIADKRGADLLEKTRTDSDVNVAASAVFAIGQLRLPASVVTLDAILANSATPSVVAREAAQALGKIQAPEARAALAKYLAGAPASAATAPIVGEALLSWGRFTAKDDVTPVVRWITSKDVEIRWRVAWALFRPRDPAAIPHIMKLLDDSSADVRFWAVRGLAPAVVDAAGMDRAVATERLQTLFRKDGDRRVRTEAIRALLQFDDARAYETLMSGLRSADSWISVSAAEAAGRFTSDATELRPVLADVAKTTKSTALRTVILQALSTLAPNDQATIDLAAELSRSDASAARSAATQAAARRAGGQGQGRGAGGGGRAAQPPRPGLAARPDAEYRKLVEQWIVPAYNGAPAPHAIWETPRGSLELELYPGDAPFGVEEFIRLVQSGDIVGTEFTRLVPNFVAQQQGIRNATTLRDEVNQRGLTRANLSWASAGLDTGRPGYTLGHTPQPHNEGNFTSLGRVVKGMDAVDRLELGDKISAARMIK